MGGEGLTDAVLGFDAELRREMLCVIDRLTVEISADFSKFVIMQTNTPFFTVKSA